MNYEQKYKDALEAARCIYKNMQDGCNLGGIEDLETIFPELKESEDERIRKEIIEYLSFTPEKDLVVHPERQRWIAYLEKQQEQKVDIDKLRKDLYQSGYDDGYQHEKEDTQEEQKPVEWSGEYLICLGYLADFVEKYGDKFYGGNKSNVVKWIRSLMNHSISELVKWSEEDVEKLAKIRMSKSGTLKNEMIFYRQGVRDAFNYKGFRLAWKPSEDQMKALRFAKEYFKGVTSANKEYIYLVQLYGDLIRIDGV